MLDRAASVYARRPGSVDTRAFLPHNSELPFLLTVVSAAALWQLAVSCGGRPYSVRSDVLSVDQSQVSDAARPRE